MKRTFILLLLVFASTAVFSQTVEEKAEAYISKYSAIAVNEMKAKGIPASITLAQGLLESGYGESRLAKEANNHFGIKCHSDWKGESIAVDDDKKGECFRKYPSADMSYYDHSDFLRFKERYASLFNLEVTDYKSWAYGLKKAGYATDPQYASKLISMVEKYNLNRFDNVQNEEGSEDAGPLPTPEQLEKPVRYTGQGHKGSFAVALGRELLEINGIPFIYARKGETYTSIAVLYDMFPSELMRYNDSKSDRELAMGEVVYLRTKASRGAKGLDKHICQTGDTMYSISQKYAIRLRALMRLNSIKDSNHVLREDDTIILRHK